MLFLVPCQENMELDEKTHADLTIRVFMSIYNCEIDHVKAISNMLMHTDNRDPTNMLWQILGQMNTSIYRQNIMSDLNCVLRMMVLEQSTSLAEKICNPTGFRHEALIYTKIHQNLRCRLSLTMLRETVLTGRNKLVNSDDTSSISQNDKMLLDLPLNMELWATKSSTEKQIILLIVSIQNNFITSKYSLINSLFGKVLAESIDTCVVSPARMQQITKYTMQILPKINNNIDMSNTDLINMLEQFSQDCFAGVFGVLQQDLMTMSFIAQMYIIAYIDTCAQHAFYKDVVSFFNNRIQNIHKELLVSEYVSPQLISNMNAWNSKHKFSEECMSAIFHLITI